MRAFMHGPKKPVATAVGSEGGDGLGEEATVLWREDGTRRMSMHGRAHVREHGQTSRHALLIRRANALTG